MERQNEMQPSSTNNSAREVFPAQVAGQFYTADANELRTQVRGFINAAKVPSSLRNKDIVGILSPHAGYVYSGPVAGYAYAAAAESGAKIVIVMALNHRRAGVTVSLLNMDTYETPLGEVPIHREAVQQLIAAYPDTFSDDRSMFENEHSLEVQLPFIQEALPDAEVVPMIVACMDETVLQRASEALKSKWGSFKDVLFVISSDLSHFFPYAEAQGYDNTSLSLLEQWKIDDWLAHASNSRKGMCGVKPLYTFARVFDSYDTAKREVVRLRYMNSGDTAGDKSQVVGYGALAFVLDEGIRTAQTPGTDFGPYDVVLRRELMRRAKAAVRAAVRGEKLNTETPAEPLLQKDGAAFVTLKKKGQLRGCIGHVIARVPLYQCINDVAMAAATRDTRFSPVTEAELSQLSYEISILTAPKPTTPDDVVVGRDGLIISRGPYSGLLLPQVPIEWNWNREQFLSHTCQKAGLPMDCWTDDETQIQSFRAIVFGEDDL